VGQHSIEKSRTRAHRSSRIDNELRSSFSSDVVLQCTGILTLIARRDAYFHSKLQNGLRSASVISVDHMSIDDSLLEISFVDLPNGQTLFSIKASHS